MLMIPIHLSLRLQDGSRQVLQMLAPSTSAALEQALAHFGDAVRGASARPLAFKAPGLLFTANQHRAAAANDAHFAQVQA